MIAGDVTSKTQIKDTNGYKTVVNIALTADQVKKIKIDENQNYFVLREHDGKIEKIEATLTIDENNNYVFTFETDKFSAYAIYSEDKPLSPHTGVNNSIPLVVALISLVAMFISFRLKRSN